MSHKEGCEVEIDGEDAMKVEVYKKGSESIVWGIGKRKEREKEIEEKKLGRRKWIGPILYNPISSGELGENPVFICF